MWLLSPLSAFPCAEGVSVACGGVGSPWSMGRVSHQGLWRTAWLGDCSGWGRCHPHSAHVIASLGNVGVSGGWCCGCCCCTALPREPVVVWACACSCAAVPTEGASLLVAGGVVAAFCSVGESGWCGPCSPAAVSCWVGCCHPQFQWPCHHWFQPPSVPVGTPLLVLPLVVLALLTGPLFLRHVVVVVLHGGHVVVQ